ncbi:MAG: ABC-2 family transporter protein [Planctomycetota bacterium]|nr:ABC-2 family transporter protein [Planctomycetota bacterium]
MATVSTPSTTPSELSARLRTWWIILRICIEERLVYRGDFALGTLMRFLPIVTQIFLWTAVYSSVQTSTETAADPAGQQTVAGFTRDEIIAYFLLTMVARAFSSMPGLAGGIARSIRDGSIKKYITQPVDMLGFLLLSRIAHKLVYYTVATLPFALVFYLCRGYFQELPSAEIWVAFIASLFMGFALGYYLESLLGMIGFWFLEVSSLLFVYMLFSFFLSGHMFPIGMLDGFAIFPGSSWSWGDLVRILPFQYLAYFPAAIFVGKIQGDELVRGLAIELCWVLMFMALSRIAYHRGLRRYSAFGG